MNTDDKELWLIIHGGIDTYGKFEGSDPYKIWTSWNRGHTIRAEGSGTEAIDSLYAQVKNSLFSITVMMGK